MRALTLNESLVVENRQPALHSKILAHNQIVQAGQWDQTQLDYTGANGGVYPYPIPPWGTSVKDTDFGNVAIFPDAHGILHWTGVFTDAIATQINKGEYRSDYGNPVRDAVSGVLQFPSLVIPPEWGSYLKWGIVGLIALVVFMLVLKLY